MTNNCRGRRCDPAKAVGDAACPVTVLYWDLLVRHEPLLTANPRTATQAKNRGRREVRDPRAGPANVRLRPAGVLRLRHHPEPPMPDRIPVGRTANDWPYRALVLWAFVGWLAAALFAGVGVPRDKLPYFFAPAVLLTAGAVGRRLWLHAGRAWVTPSDAGFVYESARGRMKVRDGDVIELAVGTTLVHDDGDPRCNRRAGVITLGVGGRRVPLRITTDLPLGGPDPLAPLLDRLHARLLGQARQTLAAGGTVNGDRWMASAGELRCAGDAPGRMTVLRLDEIAGADQSAGEVRVWAAGATNPVFRTPAGGPNARLLLDLLGPAVPAGPPTSTPPPGPSLVPLTPAAGGLGRLLHERDRSLNAELRVALVVGGLFGLALGCWAGRSVWHGGAGQIELLYAFVGPLLAFGAFRWAGWQHVSLLRVYDHGVSFTNPRGTTTLRFAEVGGVTYRAVRVYSNGVYQGTNATLTVTPAGARAGRAITVQGIFTNQDAGLEAARDAAVAAVAGRMLRKLEAGRSVPWAAGLTLTPDGLRTRRGLMVPYRELGWQCDAGTLYLRADGRKLAEVDDSEPDFFPGLRVLERMYAAATAGEPVAG